MRIEVADATGCPVPQFVVYAENEQDVMLLKAFLQVPQAAKETWEFRMHGGTYQDGRARAFNFGWAKPTSVLQNPGVRGVVVMPEANESPDAGNA